MVHLIRSVSASSMRLKTFIIVSLFAVLPILALGFSSYWIASKNTELNFRDSNRETMKQIQERVDEKLKALDLTVLQHAFNPIFSDFLKAPNPNIDTFLFIDTMTILNSMELLIDKVDSVQLYRPDLHLVLTPNNGSTDETKLSPEVLERISNRSSSFFWFDDPQYKVATQRSSHIVTLVRALPVSSSEPLGYLIVNLKSSAFFEVFQNMKVGKSGEMVIMTPSGSILADATNHILLNSSQIPFIQTISRSNRTEDMFNEIIDGEKMLINYWKSPYNDWKYISAMPHRELIHQLIGIRTITIGVVIVLLAISMFAALLLSRKFHALLLTITERFIPREHTDVSTTKDKDELSLIRHYIDHLHMRHSDMEGHLNESMPLMKASFLQNLLTTSLNEPVVMGKMQFYQIDMPLPCFTVLCIDLDHLRGKTERDIQLFLYAVANITEEIASQYTPHYVVCTRLDHIALIINLRPEIPETTESSISRRLAKQIHENIERLLNITAIVGIGRTYQGVEQIRRSYHEATEALQCHISEQDMKIIDIGQVIPENCPSFYPTEQEQQIITNMKLGNLENVRQLTTEFANLLIGRGVVNVNYVRQAFMQLIAVSFRVLYELGIEDRNALFSYNIYKQLGSLKTSEQMVDWINEEIYPNIINHVLEYRYHRHHDKLENVIQYIHKHYDRDMSLPFLAEMSNLPANVFSSLFKKQTGMTFTDYLISYRIEKAKELLVSSKLKIADISDLLRYQNPQSFNRVFKRITGMTPSEFRFRDTANDS